MLQDKKELHWIDFFCTIFFTLRNSIEEKSEGEKLIELREENKASNAKTS